MTAEHPESTFWRSWAEAILRFRWPVLLVTIGISVGAVHQIVNGLSFDSSTEYFASGDVALAQVLEEYRDDFGRDDFYMVIIEGDVFSPAFLDKLRKLHHELEALDIDVESQGERRADRDRARGFTPIEGRPRPEAKAKTKAKAKKKADPFGGFDDFGDGGFDDFGVAGEEDAGWGEEAGGTVIEEVTSLINVRETVFVAGSVRVRGLMDRHPAPEELPALKKRVLADTLIAGHYVGAGGRHAAITIRSDFVNEDDSRRIHFAIEEIARRYEDDGFKVYVGGLPAINAALNTLIMQDLAVLSGLSGVVMMCVLVWLFRNPVSVVSAQLVVGMASLWTMGGMALTGTPVTIVSNIIPAFVACVGMGDSVHVLTVYHDLRDHGHDRRSSIIGAVASTGTPVVFTSLTTIAGLLSFKFASTVAIQEMGVTAAFGVSLALLHSVVFLPIALSFFGSGPRAEPTDEGRQRDLIDAFLQRLTAVSETAGGRRAVLAGTLVFTAICVGGMAQLDVYHNPLVWMGDDHPTTQGVQVMDDHIGGTATVVVMVESDDARGLRDRDLLLRLEKLDEHVKAYTHPREGNIITGSVSLLNIVRETNRALHGGDQAHYRIPDTQRAVSDALLLFENAGPDELSRIATGDLRKSHLTFRVHWLDATSYVPLTDHIQRGIDEHFPAGGTVHVKTTGTTYSLVSVVGKLIFDMLKSFGVAVGVITLMMVTLLRDVRLGVVAMVPNLLPIALVLGIMGYFSIYIDLANLIIASIIIGIAVDDTIHYLHQFQARHRSGEDVEESIQHALEHAGRAMVSTSIVLALGFLVYRGSALVSIQRFGILIAIACVGALVIDILITPAVLRTLYRKEKP